MEAGNGSSLYKAVLIGVDAFVLLCGPIPVDLLNRLTELVVKGGKKEGLT